MRSLFAFVVCVCALGATSIGCTGAESGGTGGAAGSGGTGGGGGGVDGLGTIVGLVSLVDGEALAGVEIKAGGQTAITDNRGIFTLEEVPVGTVQVLVNEPAYTRGHRRVVLEDGQSRTISLKVLPKQTMTLPDASVGGVVTGTDGVRLTFPAGAFRDANGDPVAGSVDVLYALVNTSQNMAAAPGGMIAAQGDDELALESFGMVDVTFAQNDEPLTFDGTAELSFPLYAGQGFSNGDPVGLYSFDEEAGVWRQEGQGTVQDGQFIADVDHFSWWNCDKPLSDKSCITGVLSAPDGSPAASTNVDVVGLDYLTSLSAVTDADGSFCITVKRASQNNLAAFGADDDGFYLWSMNQGAGSQATECSMDCVDIGTVSLERFLSTCDETTVGDKDHVYVMRSGDATQDNAVQSALENLDQTVTMGEPYTAFVDIDLSDYNAVLLQANYNWASGDMPLEGQLQLLDWVNCGGGLVTVEWVLWKTAAQGSFAALDRALPANPTSEFTYSGAAITYRQVTPDPIMNAGLGSEFTFPAVDYAGTETYMEGRPGSTLFYNSVNLDDGVVGWVFNKERNGRVVNISTVAGPAQMENTDYARMISNSLDWVRDTTR